MDDARPVLWCLAVCPLTEALFTAPALVDLEMASYLKRRGWWIIGPDPQGEQCLAEWLRDRDWSKRLDPEVEDEDRA